MHTDTQYEVKNVEVSSDVSAAAQTLPEHEASRQEPAKALPVNGLHPVKISFITSRTDGAAEEVPLTWNELAKILSEPTVNPDGLSLADYINASAETRGEQKNGPGWLPVSLKTCGRRLEDIDLIHLLVLDFDQGPPVDEIVEKLKPLEFALHTTYSHTPTMPKSRVLLPLHNPILPAKLSALFDHLNEMFGGIVDSACGHNPAQFYYFPACPHDAKGHFDFRRNEGALLDYDKVMAEEARVRSAVPAEEPPGRVLPSAKGVSPRSESIDLKQGYPNGERTNALVRRAGSCLGKGMSLAETVAACLQWNKYNTPPLSETKVLTTCGSVAEADRLRREAMKGDYVAHMLTMNEAYVWVVSQNTPIRLADKRFVSPTDVRHTHGNSVVDVSDGPKPGRQSVGDAWLRSPLRRDVVDVVYEPGQPPEIGGCLNLWQGWGCEAIAGDLNPWLDYLGHVFGGDLDAQRWFEEWCAYPIQHPGVKLMTAVVLWSSQQGVGKTQLAQAVGRLYGANFHTITASELHGAFNSWAKGCQFVLGEENASADIRTDANKLKHIITGRTVTINEKHQPTYEQNNAMNFLFTSNHPDAFHVDLHDRRFCVWEVVGEKRPQAFYKAFATWLDAGGAEALMYHLRNLDLSKFDPYAGAPMSEAKQRMIDASCTEFERWLKGTMEPACVHRAFGKEIVSAEEIASTYRRRFEARVSTTAVGKSLARLLSRDMQRRISIPAGGRPNVHALVRREHWVLQDNDAWVAEYAKPLPAHLEVLIERA
jgi:Family of unknown function (DUF5906)/Primase C terminal 1 (PriCT-1)